MTRAQPKGGTHEAFLGLARALRPEARSILDLAPVSGDLVVALLEACRGAHYVGLFPDEAVRDRALRRLHGFTPEPAGQRVSSTLCSQAFLSTATGTFPSTPLRCESEGGGLSFAYPAAPTKSRRLRISRKPPRSITSPLPWARW